jgi:hypothetical protein
LSRYLIGIDLGTTNSVLAYIDTHEARTGHPPVIRVLEVPQLVTEGEVAAVPGLPSFLYIPGEHDLARERLALPWSERPDTIAGTLARDQGALVPDRQVSSAKSWLVHGGVDRTARILPWGADSPEEAVSPVEASARYLAHFRDAWNHRFGSRDDLRLEQQDLVLTVPASFDEEARELTVQAARDAGFERLTLVEEPLAAFYAWIATHERSLADHLHDGDIVLVCDVGGGTSDFTLIRVKIVDGEIGFERTAIGEHLLLGGDNVDLALARRVEEKLGRPKLNLRQHSALRRQCCAAKERLLSAAMVERLPVSILGAGRAVVGASLATELTRDEVAETLTEFLPLTDAGERPARDRRTALRELGLPYASDPAITRHLAAFLSQAAQAMAAQGTEAAEAPPVTMEGMVRPDAILFNGGFFAPAINRQRIAQAITRWFEAGDPSWQLRVLSNRAPERAVAIGAAYYAQVRRSGGIRIGGGSPRAYYVAVQATDRSEDAVQAICVLPRGTEEGTSFDLPEREFHVATNQPVAFTLYSSMLRQDPVGALVSLPLDEAHRHAPLITMLRFGKRSRRVPLAVRLKVVFTEVGTLELWCESQTTEHRWRLQFGLRGLEIAAEGDDAREAETSTVVSDEASAAASALIRSAFGEAGNVPTPDPAALTGSLEATLGYGKHAWAMALIRRLCDELLDVQDGRRRSPAHEARWLNLFGFCLRPGFGAALDEWRVGESRKIYLAGLTFPKDTQCQVEWLIVWQRVAGGLSAGQQQELFQRHATPLGAGGRKRSGRLNPQMEREGWRLLATLEHLPANLRASLGRELLPKIRREPSNPAFLWSLGRLGARSPAYGPLNCIVAPEVAGEWIERLLELPRITPDIASAIVQIGTCTGDRYRDVDEDLRTRAAERLQTAGISGELTEALLEPVPPSRSDALRIFGESLPEGLRLSGWARESMRLED